MSSADELRRWIREHAIALPSLDWHSASVDRLRELDEALEGKRIVLLGEPDHYVSERLDYRLLMIRFLTGHGFRWIMAERGFSDGHRIDQYLRDGREAWLDRVGSLRVPGPDSGAGDPADPFVGRWPASWIGRHRNEERWFYRQLRRMGEDEPGCALRFAGFDVDMLPGGGAEDIREIAGEWPPDPLRDELLRRVAEGAAEAPEAAKAQLEEALRFCEEHETSLRALAGDSSGFVAEALRSLRDSLEMRAELEQQLRSLDPVRMYHALGKREQWMHRRVRWLLEERDPKAKIVLVGHNEHLALRRETLWLRRASEPRLSPKYVLGDLLGQTHPGEIFGIWMLFGGGRHFPHPMDPRPQTEIPPNAERVEHILASAGIPIYLLPLQDNDPGAEPLARPWDHWTGGMDHSCILREQCDAVFFVDRVREPIDRSDDA